MSYTLSILTPSGKVFEGTVDALLAPGLEGHFGIFTQHAPFIAALKRGILKLQIKNQMNLFVIDSGILEVNAEHETIVLADQIEQVSNLEEAQKKLQMSEN